MTTMTEYQYEAELLNQHKDMRKAINGVLNIGLESLLLNEKLNKILLLITSISWFSLEKKGSIFLTIPGNRLKMAAHHNLGEPLLTLCNEIAFGQCSAIVKLAT